mmetsp:Transcript_21928/g.85934  ORF Transcript_21928/g.85934 Transcript_21928/m.85934 type:complete len:200 (+) Transcript_21928:198-797(+)
MGSGGLAIHGNVGLGSGGPEDCDECVGAGGPLADAAGVHAQHLAVNGLCERREVRGKEEDVGRMAVHLHAVQVLAVHAVAALGRVQRIVAALLHKVPRQPRDPVVGQILGPDELLLLSDVNQGVCRGYAKGDLAVVDGKGGGVVDHEELLAQQRMAEGEARLRVDVHVVVQVAHRGHDHQHGLERLQGGEDLLDQDREQ